jgi:hypothetical protein
MFDLALRLSLLSGVALRLVGHVSRRQPAPAHPTRRLSRPGLEALEPRLVLDCAWWFDYQSGGQTYSFPAGPNQSDVYTAAGSLGVQPINIRYLCDNSGGTAGGTPPSSDPAPAPTDPGPCIPGPLNNYCYAGMPFDPFAGRHQHHQHRQHHQAHPHGVPGLIKNLIKAHHIFRHFRD